MCLGRIRKKKKDKIISSSVHFSKYERYPNAEEFAIRALGFKRSTSNLKEARLKILANSPGRCRCMYLEESASDGGGRGRGGGCRRRWHGGRGLNKKRWEGRGPSLARRRNEDGGNTYSGCVHAFQGFRESGEYDGGDVSLNIWRGRDFKRTRVTALGRRLNNAKSTYSPACRPAPSPSFFLSFLFRLSLSLFLSVCLSTRLSSRSFAFPSPFLALAIASCLCPPHFSPQGLFQSASSFFPLSLSRFLYPFLFRNLLYYRVIFCIQRLVGNDFPKSFNHLKKKRERTISCFNKFQDLATWFMVLLYFMILYYFALC